MNRFHTLLITGCGCGIGLQGPVGPRGKDGIDGLDGSPGSDGKPGKDADDVQIEFCFECPRGYYFLKHPPKQVYYITASIFRCGRATWSTGTKGGHWTPWTTRFGFRRRRERPFWAYWCNGTASKIILLALRIL